MEPPWSTLVSSGARGGVSKGHSHYSQCKYRLWVIEGLVKSTKGRKLYYFTKVVPLLCPWPWCSIELVILVLSPVFHMYWIVISWEFKRILLLSKSFSVFFQFPLLQYVILSSPSVFQYSAWKFLFRLVHLKKFVVCLQGCPFLLTWLLVTLQINVWTHLGPQRYNDATAWTVQSIRPQPCANDHFGILIARLNLTFMLFLCYPV